MKHAPSALAGPMLCPRSRTYPPDTHAPCVLASAAAIAPSRAGLLSVRRSKIRAMNRRRLVLLALPAACFLAACGGSLTIGSIEDKLNEQIPEEVAAVGVDVSGVDCPDDASVEVGSTFECDVTAVENDQDVIYTATVTVETDDTVGWELTDVRLADGS